MPAIVSSKTLGHTSAAIRLRLNAASGRMSVYFEIDYTLLKRILDTDKTSRGKAFFSKTRRSHNFYRLAPLGWRLNLGPGCLVDARRAQGRARTVWEASQCQTKCYVLNATAKERVPALFVVALVKGRF